jgi:hypothetical protein
MKKIWWILIGAVLLLFMLIALMLIRNMYGPVNPRYSLSIGNLNEQVFKQMEQGMDEEAIMTILLGSDRIAKIRAGTENFGIAIGARTRYGSGIENLSSVQYRLEAVNSSSCYKILGEEKIKKMFAKPLGTNTNMDAFREDIGAAIISVSIPSETNPCNQIMLVTFIDNTRNSSERIGMNSFTIQVLKKSLF